MPSWLLSGKPVSEDESWALSAAYHLGPGFNLVPLQGEHFADLYTFKTTQGGVISGMWNGQVGGSILKTFALAFCFCLELKPYFCSGMVLFRSVNYVHDFLHSLTRCADSLCIH